MLSRVEAGARRLQTFQNEMEVGTGRALSAVILVTWTATPRETASAVVRIPLCPRM